MVTIQNRKLALGVAKPHAAQAVGELNHHACLRKVLAAAIGGPHSIGQTVQAVTSERNPHSSAAILCDCLEVRSLIGHLFGQINSYQTVTDQTPETRFHAEPN